MKKRTPFIILLLGVAAYKSKMKQRRLHKDSEDHFRRSEFLQGKRE